MSHDYSKKIQSIAESLLNSVVSIKTDLSEGTGMSIGSHVILTNSHVVDDAEKLVISTKNNEKMIGFTFLNFHRYDLAYILIPANLPAVKFADNPKLKEGQTVIALGHPMGYDFTITQGILSHKERYFKNVIDVNHIGLCYLQTDTAISPGNSGGPLVNLNGKVIGINTFVDAAEYSQNLNFALSVKHFKTASEYIVKYINSESFPEDTICSLCANVCSDKNYYCPMCGEKLYINSYRKEILYKLDKLKASYLKENKNE